MIDLRSDTVTQPSEAMMQAMMAAETGDDVYGEDPTVSQLESLGAELTGLEKGLFVSSGTQGNLLALLAQCERGDEYIAGQQAHAYRFEAGGAAVLGSIQPQPLPFNDLGELNLDDVAATVKPDDFHFARTRLVCLENTQAGKVLSLDYLENYSDLVDGLGLRKHLDGARVFNAAVKLGIPVAGITKHFHSVSICLSKGLAAPVGSLLVSDAETIAKARRWRKMLGGGMRQAGILAAAGIHALNHHVDRLADDHRRAAVLADALCQMHRLDVVETPETNMVILKIASADFPALKQFMAERDITISAPRLVLHRDINDDQLALVIEAFREFDQHG